MVERLFSLNVSGTATLMFELSLDVGQEVELTEGGATNLIQPCE